MQDAPCGPGTGGAAHYHRKEQGLCPSPPPHPHLPPLPSHAAPSQGGSSVRPPRQGKLLSHAPHPEGGSPAQLCAAIASPQSLRPKTCQRGPGNPVPLGRWRGCTRDAPSPWGLEMGLRAAPGGVGAPPLGPRQPAQHPSPPRLLASGSAPPRGCGLQNRSLSEQSKAKSAPGRAGGLRNPAGPCGYKPRLRGSRGTGHTDPRWRPGC